MSGVFHLLYHGHYVRLIFLSGRAAYELVERRRATPFTSDAEAWTAAAQHHLTPEQVTIESVNGGAKGNAECKMQNAEREAA